MHSYYAEKVALWLLIQQISYYMPTTWSCHN